MERAILLFPVDCIVGNRVASTWILTTIFRSCSDICRVICGDDGGLVCDGEYFSLWLPRGYISPMVDDLQYGLTCVMFARLPAKPLCFIPESILSPVMLGNFDGSST